MARKKQEKIEFRYYEMPPGSYILPMLGEHWRRPYGHDTKCLHFHNYVEIGYCYDGEGVLMLNDRKCPYFANTFSVIPPNFPHSTVSAQGGRALSSWEFLFVDTEGFLRDTYPDRPRLAQELQKRICRTARFLTSDGSPELAGLIQEIIRESRYQEEYYREKLRGLLLNLLVEIARLSPAEPSQREKTREDRLNQVKISNALHHIAKHYSEHIHIGTLAEKCSLSETHFRRIFRDVMNMSPMEYVNFVRIQTACNLMERTDASIEEIAMKTGFISLSTFNRNFRKVMHVSPHQWRRRPDSPVNYRRGYNVQLEEGWE